MPRFLKNSLNLMPDRIPSKKIKTQKIYSPLNGKKISRVALLIGCVQRVISPEINEATIRLLNRHNVEGSRNARYRMLRVSKSSFRKERKS
jgi:glycolate oxidase iron-sulfur subunit